MKKPRFSLQKILDIKEMMVETHAVELEKSKQELNGKRDELESMQVNKDQTLAGNETIQRPGSSLNPMSLQLSRDYVIQLSTRIENQEKTVAESTSRVTDQHQALIKANQRKKALEILKGKHLTEYRKEIRKKEQSEEAEIAQRLRGAQQRNREDS
ncbi:MAG: flagellar export protein FliJ [Candidatus Marinimicrobia bacterium]|nr:flagellar export protein FliJ [Candidatus Neomarinimicrobiota bacterium]MCF7841159.1 flagellar export protein FliJ [Candidatus Neomarinimicrobiota bacterium]MCF7901940.1 flagellar export protein FliJ [Candidatus Neomarinimicrobiota bacterium]